MSFQTILILLVALGQTLHAGVAACVTGDGPAGVAPAAAASCACGGGAGGCCAVEAAVVCCGEDRSSNEPAPAEPVRTKAPVFLAGPPAAWAWGPAFDAPKRARPAALTPIGRTDHNRYRSLVGIWRT